MSDQDNTPEKIPETQLYSELVQAYNAAAENVTRIRDAIEAAKDDEETTDQQRSELVVQFTGAVDQAERLKREVESKAARDRAVSRYNRLEITGRRLQVKEPDMYVAGGRSFMSDLYWSEIKHQPAASERISKHQGYEIEKRGEEFAVTSSTLGGIIPPAYLIDLYAKASRNGRVYADQCNGGQLPDVGMSVILPRLTVGLSAGSQATENTALTTSDPTEVDLSVPVRTIGGYSPVSRQSIERAAYSDQILFEDLIARYWAQLDSQAINGAGTSGTLTGVLQTSSISASTASTATVVSMWPKIADVIQQINAATGGLGYVADKIVMHPRRWGFFEAAVDSQNRPLLGITGQPAFNVVGEGSASGYGYVGRMHGLPVFTDANVPTNLGASTNQDAIIVMASSVVHLFERANDPVTLSFEQQAGTSLQVQLIAYGYVAFTAGRYPAASGAVTGAGLVAPTF
jgi:HK97 family phage major capsid protein